MDGKKGRGVSLMGKRACDVGVYKAPPLSPP